jgi:glycine/D-amino acid oxidase-like deaminating enzyme
MPGLAEPMVPSLYVHTAPPAIATGPMDGDLSVSVCIVGAGYTGLSAALHLAELKIDAVAVDGHEPGWGASGRNGGQVNPGLKREPEDIERDFGPELGGRMVALAGGAPAYVFQLIKRLAINCEASSKGTIRAAVTAARFACVRAAAEQWARRGAPVEVLGRDGMKEMIGTDYYVGGLFDRRGGSLNPLGYARGLAAAAIASGARIFSATRAIAIARRGPLWEIQTTSGTIRCAHLIIATNGYTSELWPSLSRSIVPVHSAIAATEPLEPSLRRSLLMSRPVVYEYSGFYAYYRIDSFGHLLMGAGSPLRDTADPSDFAHLCDHAVKLFPALASVVWQYFWNGQTAMTADHYPHVHEPASGVHIGLGFNGRGVAMATVMGRLLADRVHRPDNPDFELPITAIRPIAFHRFWKTGVYLRKAYGRLRDRLGF